MSEDWKKQLSEMRENLPKSKGNGESQEPLLEATEEPVEVQEVSGDTIISTKSPLYISYGHFYDLDPSIQQTYPEGVQQYLNALLHSMEAGQMDWPASISNRTEALEPIDEKSIKQWFETSGRAGMEEAGIKDPEKHLSQILRQEEAIKPVSEAESKDASVDFSELPTIIEDPDQGESQVNFFRQTDAYNKEVNRRAKKKPGETATESETENQKETQQDFLHSVGMKRQEQNQESSGLYININTGKDKPSVPRQKRKLDRRAVVSVDPKYKKTNYRPGETAIGLSVPEQLAKEFKFKGHTGRRELKVLKAEIAANVRKPEFDFMPDRHQLKINFRADVNEQGTIRERDFYVYVNLPKEAEAQYLENPEQVREALLELVAVNEGSRYPKILYNTNSQSLDIGFGNENNFYTAITLSPKDLRDKLPDLADDVNQYMSRKFATHLAFEEKQKMWNFEKLLEKTVGTNSNGQRVELTQQAWDDAFSQVWKQKVGEQKLAELSVNVLENSGTGQADSTTNEKNVNESPRATHNKDRRNPERTRWAVSEGIAEKLDSRTNTKKFLKIITEKFGTDYLAFLKSGEFWRTTEEAKVQVPDAINILAKQTLLDAGRANDYAEFKEFADLPKDRQMEILTQNGVKVDKGLTASILVKRLGLFFTRNEEDKAGFVDKHTGARVIKGGVKGYGADYGPRPTPREYTDVRLGPAALYRDMQLRNQQIVAKRGFSDYNDPDLLIGNLKV